VQSFLVLNYDVLLYLFWKLNTRYIFAAKTQYCAAALKRCRALVNVKYSLLQLSLRIRKKVLKT